MSAAISNDPNIVDASNTDDVKIKAFEALRKDLRDIATGFGQASLITDGVNSNKVRAFSSVMRASGAGYVFDGQAQTITTDWANASGSVISEKSMASAVSKTKVWIIAGRSNASPETVAIMSRLASADQDKARRYFEKLTTALRQTTKLARPLTEVECDNILTGAREEDTNPFAELVAAFKRAVSAYKSADKSVQGDKIIIARIAMAESDLQVAQAQYDRWQAEHVISSVTPPSNVVKMDKLANAPVSAPVEAVIAPVIQPTTNAGSTENSLDHTLEALFHQG